MSTPVDAAAANAAARYAAAVDAAEGVDLDPNANIDAHWEYKAAELFAPTMHSAALCVVPQCDKFVALRDSVLADEGLLVETFFDALRELHDDWDDRVGDALRAGLRVNTELHVRDELLFAVNEAAREYDEACGALAALFGRRVAESAFLARFLACTPLAKTKARASKPFARVLKAWVDAHGTQKGFSAGSREFRKRSFRSRCVGAMHAALEARFADAPGDDAAAAAAKRAARRALDPETSELDAAAVGAGELSLSADDFAGVRASCTKLSDAWQALLHGIGAAFHAQVLAPLAGTKRCRCSGACGALEAVAKKRRA